MSDSVRPHGLQATRLLQPWDSPGKSTGVGCECLLHLIIENLIKKAFWRVPWWSSGKESTCQRRRHWFDPWSRKTAPAVGPLSLWATTADVSALELCLATRDATTIETRARHQRGAPTLRSKRKALPHPRRPRVATYTWVWQKERAFYVWVYGRNRTKLVKDRKCLSVLLLPKFLVEKHSQTENMHYQTYTCKLTGKSPTQRRSEGSGPPDGWSGWRDTMKVKNAFISQEWCLVSHKSLFPQTWPKPRRDTSQSSNMFFKTSIIVIRLPWWLSGKESTCSAGATETRLWSLGQEDPWRRAWQPTPVFLPGESRGQRSLGGYSPWGWRESDMTIST